MKKHKKDEKKGDQPPLFDLSAFTVTPEDAETQQNTFNYKIDDVTFWGVMVAALGIPNRAVKIFQRDYDIKISRQAVSMRANKHPERLNECRELILDQAEEIGMNLLLNGDKRTQVEVYKHITSKLGKTRGYSEKIEGGGTADGGLLTVRVEHVPSGVPFADNEKDIQA